MINPEPPKGHPAERHDPDGLAPAAGLAAHESAAPERRGTHWPLMMLLVIAAALLLTLQWRRPRPADPLVGISLPPLEVGGWINRDHLTPADLRGQVVLMDFWSTDCGPCIRQMPELIQFHKRFKDQGLIVVGLTPEPDLFGRVTRFVGTRRGMDWPVAHGAGLVFNLTGVDATPTYILFDRMGRSVWAGHWLEDAEQAVIQALATKTASQTPT